MKYKVTYLKPKKHGYSKQSAMLLTIEDASFWEKCVTQQGCKDVEIVPFWAE